MLPNVATVTLASVYESTSMDGSYHVDGERRPIYGTCMLSLVQRRGRTCQFSSDILVAARPAPV
jgi:hypothetical protein